MKKTIKLLVRFFSLCTLTILVFSAGLISKFAQSGSDKKEKTNSDGLLSVFEPGLAHADSVSSDGPSTGDGPCDSSDGDGDGDGGSDGC